jgi:hypothetical protein
MKRIKWKEYAKGCERRISEMHLIIRDLERKIERLEKRQDEIEVIE